MDKSTVQAFKSALEAAEIKNYAYITDLPTYLYNNGENSIALEDMGNEIVYSIRDNGNFGSGQYFQNSDLVVMGAKFEDIHEVRFGASYDQAIAFVNSLGLDIIDDQKELILSIASSKRPIKSQTGNYTFKELTQEEYDELTPEEKEEYDAAKLAKDRERYGMTRRQISMDTGLHL